MSRIRVRPCDQRERNWLRTAMFLLAVAVVAAYVTATLAYPWAYALINPKPIYDQTLAATTPASAAIAWYAARLHLSTDRVQVLQQQCITGGKIKVMVIAQVSKTNLPTAFVTVEQSSRGWTVP